MFSRNVFRFKSVLKILFMDPIVFLKKNCSKKQTCSLCFVDTNVFVVFCINKRILCFAEINRFLCIETRILCVLLEGIRVLCRFACRNTRSQCFACKTLVLYVFSFLSLFFIKKKIIKNINKKNAKQENMF